jgi:hypothetical protein
MFSLFELMSNRGQPSIRVCLMPRTTTGPGFPKVIIAIDQRRTSSISTPFNKEPSLVPIDTISTTKRVKWNMFVDDDTCLNVPALLSYLQLFDHRVSLSLGYVWDDLWESRWSFHSGGAGVVFSQPAFVSVVPAIYSKECPFAGNNDVTWMHCQKRRGVPKIHSDRFFPNTVTLIGSSDRHTPVEYVGKITFHYMTDLRRARRMTCDVAAYWKTPVEGCEAVKCDDILKLSPDESENVTISDNKSSVA